MPVVKFDLAQYIQYSALLGRRYGEALHRGVLSGALRCLPVLHESTRYAIPANPSGIGAGAVNTGAYLRAWRAEKVDEGARVYNSVPYAGVIEGGRRAGSRQPPLVEIAKWALRRLKIKAPGGRKAGRRAQLTAAQRIGVRLNLLKVVPPAKKFGARAAEKEALRAAYPIARAIARRGLRARVVMTGRLSHLADVVREEIVREIQAALGAP